MKTDEPFAQELSALWSRDPRQHEYDVVIVGSGYGGSVAAAGLAGCSEGGRPLRVCVLERGRHWRPGEFPARFADLPGEVRIVEQKHGRVRANPEGLFDLRLGEDVMALVANGVGGGSLINAGVLLQPDPQDFADPRRQTWRTLLDALIAGGYYAHALRELGGVVDRGGATVRNNIDRHGALARAPLAKTVALDALRDAAAHASQHGAASAAPGPCERPPITVAMADGPNHAGVKLTRCTLCGDCLTGCNVGAKNSLDVNLLAKARRAGAEIFVGASVVSLKHVRGDNAPAHWVLRVAHTRPDLQQREPGLLYLRARRVILAAGSLGSSEILLRSRTEELRFSPRLGEGFSCNGDNIAAVHRMPQPAHGSADEDTARDSRRVGPTITASFKLDAAAASRAPQVQEFAIPAPLKRLLDQVITTASALSALPEEDPTRHGCEEAGEPDPLAVNPAHIEHTLVVGLIGHDAAAGSLRLPQPVRPREGPAPTGTLCIHWPQARSAAVLDAPHEHLAEAVRKGFRRRMRTRLLANPVWRLLPDKLKGLVTQPRGPVLTVHPLGGCGIGADFDEGVVDQWGRVFDARPQCDLYIGGVNCSWFDTLVVLDGSIIPGSLGVNPALTITALAMHAIDQLRQAWQLTDGLPWAAPPALPAPQFERPRVAMQPAAAAVPTEVGIIERLRGPVWLDLGEWMPRRCIVELTLAYKPVAVRSLASTLERRVEVDPDHAETRLRIYDERQWQAEHLRVRSDAQRKPWLLCEARLAGELRFLHREDSGPGQRSRRARWAWLCNRGWRDLWQELREPEPESVPPDGLPAWWRKLRRLGKRRHEFRALATRAGEVRRFDYALTIVEVLGGAQAGPLGGPPGARISGCKRLTYNRRANPWQQLTRLRLTEMPGLRDIGDPELRLDPGFMAGVGVPLLRLTRQRDHASALGDLAAFGLYMARVLLYIHLWTFRKPDASSTAAPRRLPGRVAGVDAQITELVVDRTRRGDVPVTIRLSRYAPARDHGLPPLVLIHGYSASGSTFTHQTLRPSAAEFFYRRGRDVWVIDLRTSAGLPTATQPWAFEQAALIDIPAALLHIKAVTGRKVDVVAHCIGATMLGMAILADARGVRAGMRELGAEGMLRSEHFGQLAAFQGVPAAGQPHPCIRRVVLSQKGPVLRYTDANVLRAFLMQSLRRVVLDDNFQFRPPAEPSLADELLDRLLASQPYPKQDYDVENPLWPCATTGWTATRHRMDALYGRAFSAENLSNATLNSIDDLFGPLNIDTVAQTTHFARFCAITNQAGRGQFVTRTRLQERWSGIPTLALHGADNGLADVDTQRLLWVHMQGAGVPFEAKSYDGVGHQDLWIGNASLSVFERIETFLSNGPPQPQLDTRVATVFALPWIGPRIDTREQAAEPLRIAAMSRPDQGRARLILLPARRSAAGCTPDLRPRAAAVSSEAGSDKWLFAEPPLARVAAPAGSTLGWFAVLAYDLGETTAELPAQPAQTQPLPRPGQPPRKPAPPSPMPPLELPTPGWYATDPPPALSPLAATRPAAAQQARPAPSGTLVPPPWQFASAPPPALPSLLVEALRWLAQQSDENLAACFVSFDDVDRADRLRQPQAPQAFTFTVASCQYPYGPTDPLLASASTRAMSLGLDETSLALFVGDQIYSDATAGLLDGTRRDERYDQPYDRALRVPGLRQVLRRVPVQMLPDDHELVDNWEAFPPAAAKKWRRAEAARQETRAFGLDAFFKYQRMRSRRGHEPADLAFTHAGCPFYLLDARTQREPRGSTTTDAAIVSPAQWARFTLWLRRHRHELKFVATGSLLLPRRCATVEQASASERSDTWDGFPCSLHELLRFIVAEDVRHTVFVSGDEHHSLLAEATLDPGNSNIKLVSIHASAMYAPYPFANGRPDQLATRDVFVVAGNLVADVTTHFAPAGDGFARIDVLPGAQPRLRVTFHKAGGSAQQQEIALD